MRSARSDAMRLSRSIYSSARVVILPRWESSNQGLFQRDQKCFPSHRKAPSFCVIVSSAAAGPGPRRSRVEPRDSKLCAIYSVNDSEDDFARSVELLATRSFEGHNRYLTSFRWLLAPSAAQQAPGTWDPCEVCSRSSSFVRSSATGESPPPPTRGFGSCLTCRLIVHSESINEMDGLYASLVYPPLPDLGLVGLDSWQGCRRFVDRDMNDWQERHADLRRFLGTWIQLYAHRHV